MADKIYNSDTEKQSNPYASPIVGRAILENETQRAIENLRKAALKIINDAEVPMMKGIEFMASLGSIEEIAPSIPQGHIYLDKLAKLCRDECLKTIPPAPPKPPIDESKPHIIGFGANRHIDTGEIVMPKPSQPMQRQLKDGESDEPKTPTTVLGNPIDATPAIVETPADIAAKLEEIKEAAKTPDLSDVTALKKAAAVSFEADELGGSDETIIPAEVVSEPSELDETFGIKTEMPMYDFNAALTVANLLGSAFPEATGDWKLHFFREATGLTLVADAKTAAEQQTMFDCLNAEIALAKANPVETVDRPNTSVENATGKVPQTGHSEVATNTDSNKVLSSQTLPENPSNSTALTVVSKSEVATAPKSAVSFRMPSQEQFSYMQQLAKFVSESGYYKDVNTPAKAMVIMMKGYSLNIEPMTALDGIFVINGRPFVGAKLVKGLLEATGQCHRFDIVGDAHQCTVTIQRKGRAEPNVFKFSWEDATKAQLVSKDNWQKYPAQMLRWRAVKQAVDTEFPELAFGLGRDDEDEDAA